MDAELEQEAVGAPTELVYARSDMLRRAAHLGYAIVLTCVLGVAFDGWDPVETLVLLVAVPPSVAVVMVLLQCRRRVPRGAVTPAPAHVPVVLERSFALPWFMIVAYGVLAVVIVVLADGDPRAAPMAMLGGGAAVELASAALVLRWERAHGRRLVSARGWTFVTTPLYAQRSRLPR